MRRARLWLVVVGLLVVGAGVSAGAWLLTSEAALPWLIGRAAAWLPGQLTVGTVSGRLLGPVQATDIDYRADGLRLSIARVAFDWRPSALLANRWHFRRFEVEDAHLVLADTEPKRERRHWQLPINLAIDRGQIRRLRIEPAPGTAWVADAIDIAGAADSRYLRLERLALSGPNLRAEASGALGRGTDGIQLKWQLTPPASVAWSGGGTILGDLQKPRIRITTESPLVATVESTFDLTQPTPLWRATLMVQHATLAAIDPRWPALTVAGQATAEGRVDRFAAKINLALSLSGEQLNIDATLARDANRLTITTLTARRPAARGALTAQGHYVWGKDPDLALQLAWQDWRWPFLPGAITSPEGQARLAGSIADYRLQVQSTVTVGELPPFQARAVARGDTQSLTIDDLRLDWLGGRVSGRGEVRRGDSWRWQLAVAGERLNPATAWPDWPGALAVRAAIDGRFEKKRLHQRAVVSRLSGELRGRAVRGGGQWQMTGNHHALRDLVVRVGDASARVTGHIDKDWDVAVQLQAPTLATLLPDAAGAVHVQARLSGSRQAPTIAATATVDRARYRDYRLAQLQTQWQLHFDNRRTSTVTASAAGIGVGAHTANTLRLTASGRVEQHTAQLTVKFGEHELRAHARGRYLGGAWSADFDRLTLATASGDWSLQQPAPLRISRDRLTLDSLCLQSQDRGRACAAIDFSNAGPGHLDLDAQAIPLAWFNAWLPPNLRWRGTADARGRAQLDRGRVLQANAKLELGQGALYSTALAKEAVLYQRATAQLVIDDSGLNAHAHLQLTAEDHATARLALPHFNPRAPAGPTQPLTGEIRLRMQQLPAFDEWITAIAQPQGRLDVALTLGGTVGRPIFGGNATLRQATALVPALGLRLRDGWLRADADGSGAVRLNGAVGSGDGALRLQGRFAPGRGDDWLATLQLTGDRVQAADLPIARVVASPDLQLRIGPRRLQLTGRVHIPRATLAPQPLEIPLSTSRDVVLVDTPGDNRERRWDIETQVQVSLGDEVTFDGFGLSGNIAGSVVAQDSSNRLTTARGELRIVEGEYEAYGRKLAIERGRLLYAGGPIDNPGLDARAVRKVEAVTAGVIVKGTLKAPELTLFSEPSLNESDTLSYLLFGRPLESTSSDEGRTLAAATTALKLSGGQFVAKQLGTRLGIDEVSIDRGRNADQAALVLGKHFSPRLYINYSIGLFEQVNVLRLRYKLGASWALQVESGTYAGADVLYTIER